MIENVRSINIISTLVLVIGILFIMGPILIAFMTATLSYDEFVAHGGISTKIGSSFFDNLYRVLFETDLPAKLINSAIISFLVAFVKCAFAFTATFALVFYTSRLNTLIFAMTIVTVMLPLDLIVITVFQMVANVLMPLNWLMDLTGLGWLIETLAGSKPYFEYNMLNSYLGVALPIATSSTSVFIYRQFFMTLPKDLPRAAMMDGAGPIRFMIDILLPLSKAPLVATFMFWFIGGWTAYLWPLVAASTPASQPAVVGLAKLASAMPDQTPDVPLFMAGALFVSFIPVVIIAVMQRQIIRGLNLSEK